MTSDSKMNFMDIMNVTSGEKTWEGIDQDKKLDAKHNYRPKVYAEEHEQIILSATLNEVCTGKAPTIDFLTAEHFSEEFLGDLYSSFINSYNECGVFNVQQYILDIARDEQDIEHLRSFFENLSSRTSFGDMSLAAEHYAYELDDYKKRNDAINLLQEQIDKLKGIVSLSTASKQLDDMQTKLSQLTYHQVSSQAYSYEEGIEAFKDDFYSDTCQSIPTGLSHLDEALSGGFFRGDLIICAGRPGMGKTAFLIHATANIAEQGFNCLCFHIEMNNNQNSARIVSREMNRSKGIRMPYKELRHAMNSDTKHKDIYRHAFETAQENTKSIFNNYNQTITANEIVAYAEKHAQMLQREGKRLDFIAVDYLQILSMSGKNPAHLEIGQATGKMKQLAKKLDIPVLLLSQLNRSVEADNRALDDKRPDLHHLRQSGKIEEDADLIMFPFRPSYYERNKEEMDREWMPHYMEMIIAKNRSGENGITKVSADMATNWFCDMPQEETGKVGLEKSDSKWG